MLFTCMSFSHRRGLESTDLPLMWPMNAFNIPPNCTTLFPLGTLKVAMEGKAKKVGGGYIIDF